MRNQNIAGSLPENGRNRFVDLQSQEVKKTDQNRNLSFSLRAEMVFFDYESVYVIAASINCSQITFI